MAQTAPPTEPDPAKRANKKSGTTFWNNPLTATGIVVLSAVVVGLAIDGLADDDDEQPASAN